MSRVAFVLGGGGVLGAAEAGMALALLESGVRPDLVCGTSVGAINGAALAADPTPEGARALVKFWDALGGDGVFGGSLIRRAAEVLRRPTSLHDNSELRRLLRERLPVHTFEELAVPFECVAASIERAREHWFDSGDLVEPVLASCALPGVLPPVRIGDEHFFDGGLVNSIPLDRAVSRGADTIWVLHVGVSKRNSGCRAFCGRSVSRRSRSPVGTGSTEIWNACVPTWPSTSCRRVSPNVPRRRGRICATATAAGSGDAPRWRTTRPANT